MLYAIRHPVALIGLVLGFVVGSLVHGWVQALVAARSGDRGPVAAGRGRPDLKVHLDPFGAVAAVLGGVGWAAPVLADRRRYPRRGRLVAVALAGPLANVVLGVVGLVVFVAAGGPRVALEALDSTAVLHGSFGPDVLSTGQLVALGFGVENLMMALLSLIPLPPLEASHVMFASAPRTRGWLMAEYRLVEQNWGIGILLFLIILPLIGNSPPIVYLLSAILDPIVSALS